MQRFFSFITLVFFTNATLSAQTVQEIALGAGYTKQSFINLSTGVETQVNNIAWDLGFSVYGQQDAGVFVNESAGTSAGVPQAQVQVYDAMTTDFQVQPDPTMLTARLYNAEKTWAYGAFNETRSLTNPFDYGWGVYNTANNKVEGSKVFVIKLRSGSYLKLQVVSLVTGLYTFKYANLDGTNEVTKTINKADFTGKTLAYFSFTSNTTVDVEPVGGHELVYCRYVTPYLDPSTGQYVPYNLTGILQARGMKVAKALNIAPTAAQFTDFQDSLKTNISTIGYDWKTFNSNVWATDQNRAYFLKTPANRVWKINFIDFEGSTTGKTILEKTDLGIFIATENQNALGLQALTYPNPVQNELTIALNSPIKLANTALLEITDVQGRLVMSQTVALSEGLQVFNVATETFGAGVYIAQLTLPTGRITLGKVVKL